ncbi:MAG: hypothetical protein BHW06_03415 [Clostridium sp. 44_14]|nr:MAG: hypothetical protein BHW06_03415 [Clostridium sp. 44_14]
MYNSRNAIIIPANCLFSFIILFFSYISVFLSRQEKQPGRVTRRTADTSGQYKLIRYIIFSL